MIDSITIKWHIIYAVLTTVNIFCAWLNGFPFGLPNGFLAVVCGFVWGWWSGQTIKQDFFRKDDHNGKTNAILQARKTPNREGYEGNHIVHQITIPKKIIKETGWKKGDIITMHTFGKILKMERNQ